MLILALLMEQAFSWHVILLERVHNRFHIRPDHLDVRWGRSFRIGKRVRMQFDDDLDAGFLCDLFGKLRIRSRFEKDRLGFGRFDLIDQRGKLLC